MANTQWTSQKRLQEIARSIVAVLMPELKTDKAKDAADEIVDIHIPAIQKDLSSLKSS